MKTNFFLYPLLGPCSVTTLQYYAAASFLKVLGDTMGISKASASGCVHDVAECLCELAQDWIKFPTASGNINVNKYDP